MRNPPDAAVERSRASPAALGSRERTLIVCCIVALAALAWGYLLYVHRQMAASVADADAMRAMGMALAMPATGGLLFLFAMWAVMMLAMMAGPAIPMFLLFSAAQARRAGNRLPRVVPMFGLGYAIVWLGFSAGAALAQWALQQAAALSPAMAAESPRVAGLVLVAAGLYQLSPLKTACLSRCRSPLGFLMTRWRDGGAGALVMGLRYGAWCVGCCWALMGILFVVGVMSLPWIAALMVLVLAEKAGPAGMLVARLAGMAAIAAGVVVLA